MVKCACAGHVPLAVAAQGARKRTLPISIGSQVLECMFTGIFPRLGARRRDQIADRGMGGQGHGCSSTPVLCVALDWWRVYKDVQQSK